MQPTLDSQLNKKVRCPTNRINYLHVLNNEDNLLRQLKNVKLIINYGYLTVLVGSQSIMPKYDSVYNTETKLKTIIISISILFNNGLINCL